MYFRDQKWNNWTTYEYKQHYRKYQYVTNYKIQEHPLTPPRRTYARPVINCKENTNTQIRHITIKKSPSPYNNATRLSI